MTQSSLALTLSLLTHAHFRHVQLDSQSLVTSVSRRGSSRVCH